MEPQTLLEALYRREAPILKANDWAALRVSTSQLLQDLSSIPQVEVFAAINMLRQQGKIMLLPEWNRWGLDEDESDGSFAESTSQWEPQGGREREPLSWRRRRVFLPRNEDLAHWCVRSRIAETIRLVGSNRERFGLEPATAHVGYELQERLRPSRNVAIKSVITGLTERARGGAFPRALQPNVLAESIDIVGAGLGYAQIAGFQARAWDAILLSVFGGESSPLATMLTAGVSSGKTFGFLLPAVTLLVYRALIGDGGVNRVLVIYPRTSLVEDQFHNLRRMIERVNAEMERRQLGRRLTPTPALDAGNLLGSSLRLQVKGSLADVLPEVSQLRIEVILTTPESLKNRLLDPRAARTYLACVEMVIFDEVHLMEGLSGCQQVYFVRRIRQLMREMRRNPDFQPAWVGASATVAQPVDHACCVFSIPQQQRPRVEHVRPNPDEMERFATFHHAFVHTRVGKPAISALTNGLACLTHMRNDGTAHTHYVDPSAAPLTPRPSEQMPKTIVFVDSLSTIGRLDFTTRDNERCWNADDESPYPYYTWFYRPAARLRATQGEGNQIASLPAIRSWCRKCYDGLPARIDAAALQQLPVFLRTGKTIKRSAERKATPPGLVNALAQLSGQVGNLDKCPFHCACVCWWFSQDRGDRRLFGQVPIYIDQNRPIIYTSRSRTGPPILSQNVNDYFRRPPSGADGLWYVQDDQLRRTLPREPEPVSTMLASPRIEVGVDFQNVRDGLTHKALRSAASFQQKVGRVGREDGSDSLIVTFLAHRSTDAHFAHRPSRLIDSQQLDPIPLASENRDVLATHLFTAILEYIGTRPPGVIPARGEALNIIGTGSANRVPEPWEDKVRACVRYLQVNRQTVRDYILRATGQLPAEAQRADRAIDKMIEILDLVLTDLSPAFAEGRTAAHWFKQNQQPTEIPSFRQMIEQRDRLLTSLDQAAGLPTQLSMPTQALLAAVRNGPATAISAAIASFQAALLQQTPSLPPSKAADLFRALADAQALAQSLAALPPTTNLDTLCMARQIVKEFFQTRAGSEGTAAVLLPRHSHDATSLQGVLSIRSVTDALPSHPGS